MAPDTLSVGGGEAAKEAQRLAAENFFHKDKSDFDKRIDGLLDIARQSRGELGLSGKDEVRCHGFIVDEGNFVHIIIGIGDKLFATGGKDSKMFYGVGSSGDKLYTVHWEGKAGDRTYTNFDNVTLGKDKIALSKKISPSGTIEHNGWISINDYNEQFNGYGLYSAESFIGASNKIKRLTLGLERAGSNKEAGEDSTVIDTQP